MTVDELRDAIKAICQEQYLNELTTDLYEEGVPLGTSEDLLEKSARSMWGGSRRIGGQGSPVAGFNRGSVSDVDGIELSKYQRRRMTEMIETVDRRRTRMDAASADTAR